MVILITGASHAEKTVLAQRMLEKYKYPYGINEYCVEMRRPQGFGKRNGD